MSPHRVWNEDKSAEMPDAATIILKAANLRSRLAELLRKSASQVRRRLYIRVHPPQTPDELLSLLPTIYENAARECPDLDVRLLLGAPKPQLKNFFDSELNAAEVDASSATLVGRKRHERVVLGGTFDRFHYGHKLLLSTAILHANEYIVCGVTDKEMNHKKTLWEFIEPVEKRIAAVNSFVRDVSTEVKLRAEPITDPFGPSIVDPNLQCIIVSQETRKGGNAVNLKREERNLSTLQIVEIGLLDGRNDVLKESKLSSSAARFALLGQRLRPPQRPDYDYADEKYVIGLTGGICSGKTHISVFLREQGCDVIDCDRIGHEVMQESSELKTRIGETFGAELIQEDAVNRRALGALVFKNKEQLKRLNGIMWPIMEKQVLQQIRQSHSRVVVVDAAVLIDAGWNRFVHEVWTAIIPPEEAVKRTIQRDNLTEELARDRVQAQPSNSERLCNSNVVFCSLWEYSETKRQVQQALNIVRAEL